jgi:hypothetical protein
MKDAEIDYVDNPALDREFFAEVAPWSGPKQQITEPAKD